MVQPRRAWLIMSIATYIAFASAAVIVMRSVWRPELARPSCTWMSARELTPAAGHAASAELASSPSR